MSEERDRPMRRLKVDVDEVALALSNHMLELEYFFDRDTGAVELVTYDDRHILQEIEDQLPDAEDDPVALERALLAAGVPASDVEAVHKAYEIDTYYGRRYVRIEPIEPNADYRDMEAFIETVANEPLQNRLERAISGRGAFRHFRDVLDGHPSERERWYAFHDARERERAIEWLREEGIEPILD